MRLIAVLLLVYSSMSYARGGESSGGIESYRNSYAWFIGKDRKIKWCYVASPHFLFATSIPRLVTQAFKMWADYRHFKKIDGENYAPLATELLPPGPCDGSEDLKVYIGVSDEVVEHAKLKHDRPYAFVEQTKPYDPKTGWSKGFMWIAARGAVKPDHKPFPSPQYMVQEDFLIPILHEVGHIFGCEHLEGTIMSQFLGEQLDDLDRYRSQLYRIDQTRELIAGYTAVAGYDAAPDRFFLENAFARFVRPPMGKVTARFVKTETWIPEGKVTFSDATGDYTFPVKAKVPIVMLRDSAVMFRAHYGVEAASQSWGMFPLTRVFSGEVTKPDGTVLPVTLSFDVNLGMQQYAVYIQTMDGEVFFAGMPPGAR